MSLSKIKTIYFKLILYNEYWEIIASAMHTTFDKVCIFIIDRLK